MAECILPAMAGLFTANKVTPAASDTWLYEDGGNSIYFSETTGKNIVLGYGSYGLKMAIVDGTKVLFSTGEGAAVVVEEKLYMGIPIGVYWRKLVFTNGGTNSAAQVFIVT